MVDEAGQARVSPGRNLTVASDSYLARQLEFGFPTNTFRYSTFFGAAR